MFLNFAMAPRHKRKKHNRGLGVQTKHHWPGQRYHSQLVPCAGRVFNPVHTISGHLSYAVAAYGWSKLLPDGTTSIQEIVVNPENFIMLRLGREVVEQENGIEDDIFDLTDTIEENTSSTAGSCLSHKMVEKV